MAATQFLPFSVGSLEETVDQPTYVAADWRINGWRSGILPHRQINKVLRQSSMVSAAITQMIADQTLSDVNDDGNLTALVTKVKSAFSASLPYITSTTYPPNTIGWAIQTGLGSRLPTTAEIKAAVAGALTETELTSALQSRLNQIDAPTTGLVTRVNDLQTTYGSTSSAATSAAAAASSAAAALDKANQAAISQASALTSASNASTSATTATTKASEASVSASNAASSASSAAGSASSASTSATTAAGSATAAGNSATAAASSASSASTSATNAGTSASAAETSRVNAVSAAGSASTSATNAASSATSASGSASTAAAQAVQAANSASGASSSASAAAGSASSASTSATNAASSASAAQSSATAAQTSATNAASSATSASSSATASANSASAAADWFNQTVASTGTLTASVSALQTTSTSLTNRVGQAEAQYVMKVATTRADGKKVFAGIGLASVSNDTIQQSEILLQADRLVFVPSGNPEAPPKGMLVVGTVNGVATLIVNSALFGDATIGAANIGSLNGNVINAGTVKTQSLEVNSVTNTVGVGKTLLDQVSNLGNESIITTGKLTLYGGPRPVAGANSKIQLGGMVGIDSVANGAGANQIQHIITVSLYIDNVLYASGPLLLEHEPGVVVSSSQSRVRKTYSYNAIATGLSQGDHLFQLEVSVSYQTFAGASFGPTFSTLNGYHSTFVVDNKV